MAKLPNGAILGDKFIIERSATKTGHNETRIMDSNKKLLSKKKEDLTAILSVPVWGFRDVRVWMIDWRVRASVCSCMRMPGRAAAKGALAAARQKVTTKAWRNLNFYFYFELRQPQLEK